MLYEYFHASNNPHLTEIVDFEYTGMDTESRFGGLFMLPDLAAVDQYSGEYRYTCTLDEDTIADYRALNTTEAYECLRWIFGDDAVSEDELEYLFQLIALETESAYSDDAPTAERLRELFFPVTNLDEIEWEAQRIRGILARHLGFAAVYMQDENGGHSVLVFPGTRIARVS